MAWIDRILKPLGLERRTQWFGSWAGGWAGAAAGFPGAGSFTLSRDLQVDVRFAENLSAVTASVNAIASALGTAPALIYRMQDGSRREVLDHPLRRLIDRAPNPFLTWPALIEAMIGDVLLQGNGLVEIERSGGAVTGLRHVPWRCVTVSLGPSGRLIYDVAEAGFLGAAARSCRLLAGDVIHLKDRSDDGYIGRSRLSRAAGSVSSAVNGERYYQHFMNNAARPSGVLMVDTRVSDESKAQIRKDWDELQAGIEQAGKVVILDQGLKYAPSSVSPENAELLGSRKFSLEEIARIFAVPPPMIGDLSHGTFTNSREAARWFAQFTLAPWARKIEAAFTEALFPEGSGLSLELDLSGLLRGDPETRWASHKIAVEAGILDANEVREIEGFNPRTAGVA